MTEEDTQSAFPGAAALLPMLGLGVPMIFLGYSLIKDKEVFETPDIILGARQSGTISRDELYTLTKEASDIIKQSQDRTAQIKEIESRVQNPGIQENYFAAYDPGLKEYNIQLESMLDARSPQELIAEYNSGKLTFFAMDCGVGGDWKDSELKSIDYSKMSCGFFIDGGANSTIAAQKIKSDGIDSFGYLMMGTGVLIGILGYALSSIIGRNK